MKRKFSFWALIALAVGVGILFFNVVQPFLAPLFFAAVIALLIYPVYSWALHKIGGRRRSAAAVSAIVLILVFVPLSVGLLVAGREVMVVGRQLAQADPTQQPFVQKAIDWVHIYYPDADWETLQTSVARGLENTSQEIFDRTRAFLSDIVSFAVGLAIMALALYYFLAEGPVMLRRLHRLSPLQDGEEEQLFEQFGCVCRGVVLGTLLCAIAQAALLGIGLWVVGIEKVWLLAGLTLVVSMIPVIGAGGIWLPVSGWLLFQGEYVSAIGLLLYGGLVVSLSDNLIRAHVLHGSANMHPLLALVSALGGLKLVGLWGIFLGPIAAALFYTLLKVVHDRLEEAEPENCIDELGCLDEDEDDTRPSASVPSPPALTMKVSSTTDSSAAKADPAESDAGPAELATADH